MVNGNDRKEIKGAYINLQDHFEKRLKDSEDKVFLKDKILHARLDGHAETDVAKHFAMDKALELSKSEMERRLDGLNHVKEEQSKFRLEYLRKDDYENKHTLITNETNQLKTDMTKMETRYEGRVSTATWVSVVSILIAIVSILIQWLVHK